MLMINHSLKYQIEIIDKLIIRILNIARKRVEGIERNIPYSQEKGKCRAVLLH